jgi:hypothetical protein
MAKSADIEAGKADTAPPAANHSWGIMRGLCLMGVVLSSCLVVALIGSSLMGTVAVPEDASAVETYDIIAKKLYQGYKFSGAFPAQTYTYGTTTTKIEASIDSQFLFTFKNMASSTTSTTKSTVTINGGTPSVTTVSSKVYNSIDFEECNNKTTLSVDSRRRLASTEDYNTLREYWSGQNFCDMYSEVCDSAGNAAVGLVALSFALSVIVTVLMVLRICGRDTAGVYVWSTILYLLIWILIAGGVGNFTSSCVDFYGTGLNNALVPFEMTAVRTNGVVFNVLIAAIVFSVLNMGFDGYFKYEGPVKDETGIAPAAPAKA